MEYDPQQDIQDHYRKTIKHMRWLIANTNKRDPMLHKYHAQLRETRAKIADYDQAHRPLPPALVDYGTW